MAIYLLRLMNNTTNNHNSNLWKKRNHHNDNHHHNNHTSSLRKKMNQHINNHHHNNNKHNKNSLISPQTLGEPEPNVVSSPRDQLLTDALMRMSQEEQPRPQEEDNDPAQNQEHPPRLEQQKEEAPSQSVVEVLPINPTQEVIDISSSSNNEHEPQPQPIKLIVPKIEDCLVTSPSSKLVTEVLMRIGQDLGQEPPPMSQPDPFIPSFSLNLEFPRLDETHEQPLKTLEEKFLLTARTISVIESLDEYVSGHRPLLETPQPAQVIKNDLEERVAIWATMPKGDNDFDKIFRLRGHRVLKAFRYQFMPMAPKSYIDIQVVSLMCHVLNVEEGDRLEKLVYCVPPEILQRMFEAHDHNWLDKKRKRPHEISSLTNHKEYLVYLDREKLLFAPVLYSEHWWLYVLDKFQQVMYVPNSKNISSPTDERTALNKFSSSILNQMLKWAGAPSILKKGSWSLLPKYINIPQQPNNFDCAVFVMKWMELIDPTILAGCCTSILNNGLNLCSRNSERRSCRR